MKAQTIGSFGLGLGLALMALLTGCQNGKVLEGGIKAPDGAGASGTGQTSAAPATQIINTLRVYHFLPVPTENTPEGQFRVAAPEVKFAAQPFWAVLKVESFLFAQKNAGALVEDFIENSPSRPSDRADYDFETTFMTKWIAPNLKDLSNSTQVAPPIIATNDLVLYRSADPTRYKGGFLGRFSYLIEVRLQVESTPALRECFQNNSRFEQDSTSTEYSTYVPKEIDPHRNIQVEINRRAIVISVLPNEFAGRGLGIDGGSVALLHILNSIKGCL